MNKYLPLLMLLLTGCSVSEQQIDEAIKICKSHDGIFYIVGSAKSSQIEVKCNDGSKIIKALK